MNASVPFEIPAEKIPVVLYGGAFDPPTLAHEAAVRKLSEMAERVVIVPS